ncbi:VOC family protein [Nocardia arthritidis]|uniref:Glyoxalase n=1 Tax=Nocardia arthritidis TaxID=228602 RepID=A0A6G9YKQ8_9NOCA|nr:VOC family protein [Nocardia arthritidis]QIS13778.1 glyoxalase [Nocardia arthritidis]
MTISQIGKITAFVSDQDRAKEFYTGVLGMTVRADNTFGDNRWLEVGAGETGTGIILHKPFPGASAGNLAGVIVNSPDIDAVVEKLRAAGADVDGPTDEQWGRQASFSDPDGNSYVLVADGAR